MEILKVKKQKFSAYGGPAEGWKKIIKIIKEGGVIICPTDTVYGLLADATSEKAVGKIFEIKKRPKEKAIPIFVKDLKMAKKFAAINKKQEKILKEKWPGKFTFVLKRQGAEIFGVNKKTIALRIPKFKLVNELLKKFKKPLTGTSANISGKPASTRIKDVIKQFEGKKYQPDLILDAGNLKKSEPSTIINLTGSELKILRKGDFKIK
jgi:L-threonylcarbamoyladenylate synthase